MTTHVGVYPSAALRSRVRLFGALAEALPVRFHELDRLPESPGDPVVVLDAELDDPLPGSGCRFIAGASSADAEVQAVSFGDSPALDARLRMQTLHERSVGAAALAARDGDDVLASAEGRPVWLQRNEAGLPVDVSAHTPRELADGEYLRDRIDPGSFVALLPLVHFLRDVTAGSAWDPSPTRAAFLVDDPNLHWRSYGYLDYAELVADARANGYHVSIATVPLDAWYAHRPTVRLFHESRDALSLSVHGNDHVMHELGRPRTIEEARRVLAQARRRIAALERRTGLDVSPVMVPPYEASSPASLDAILDVGFEAATVTRPCTWLPLDPGASSYATPDGDDLLSGWHPAELTKNGLPLHIRRLFHEHDEIVLRSFLDQPVILYGHVEDFEDGLDPLRKAAAIVNSLPSVAWGSLGDLATGSFQSRRRGAALEVRTFGRRIRVPVGPAVTEVRLVAPPRRSGFANGVQASLAGNMLPVDGDVVALPGGRAEPVALELAWGLGRSVGGDDVAVGRSSARAVARRLAVESKDRLRPPLRRRRTRRPTPPTSRT